ncbi:hypothetical protein [Alkalicoccobacillus murimartini]|uniref:Nitrogen fixation-related uncharacterized protein n=1 Tax=Alkalicoccobacillus murimartini TaxID=171685 RepID=A0ABT9YLA4_9BACI|nr:hypothetical protein [Alkalicoccobacillus murimartini]MDQ0208419.1 nitrogen fixation-related uncharacterized protein [Alkalicoccobacillus murimartini]
MTKDQGIPYHDETSKLQLVLNAAALLGIQVMLHPFSDPIIQSVAGISILLALIPIIVTLRWTKEEQEDSWCRIVAKRLRDISFVFVITFILLIALFSMTGLTIHLVNAGVVVILWTLASIYFHLLYRKLVRIQNVPLSLDAKKWRADLPKDATFLGILVVLIAAVFYWAN